MEQIKGDHLTRWAIGLSVLAMITLMGGAGLLIRAAPPGSPTAPPQVAVFVGFAGVVITATVMLVGLLLKHSIDRRTSIQQSTAERRLAIDSEHNKQLAKQAEERLRLDTAIRAVDLIGAKEGTDTSTRTAGALFTLASLGQMEFALALLDSGWSADRIDTDSALWLIRRGLDSDEKIQNIAANMLTSHHRKVVSKDYFVWPGNVELAWRPDRTLYVRDNLLEICVRMLLVFPRTEWAKSALRAVTFLMYSAATTDEHPRIQASAARALDVLLSLNLGNNQLLAPSGPVAMREMREKVDAVLARSETGEAQPSIDMLEHLAELRRWAAVVESPAETGTSVSTENMVALRRAIPETAGLDDPPIRN